MKLWSFYIMLWRRNVARKSIVSGNFEYLAEFITKITTLETFYKFGESG